MVIFVATFGHLAGFVSELDRSGSEKISWTKDFGQKSGQIGHFSKQKWPVKFHENGSKSAKNGLKTAFLGVKTRKNFVDERFWPLGHFFSLIMRKKNFNIYI